MPYKCNYAGIMGHCRVVNGAVQTAAECTFFRAGTGKEPPKKPKPPAPIRKSNKGQYDWIEALRLYTAGGNDVQIAAALGCRATTVREWRYRENLRPNRTPGGRERYDWARGMVLYQEGNTDEAIAAALGCREKAVFGWRKRKGLPCNRKIGKQAVR